MPGAQALPPLSQLLLPCLPLQGEKDEEAAGEAAGEEAGSIHHSRRRLCCCFLLHHLLLLHRYCYLIQQRLPL